jgi:hypothetical protein
MTVSNFGQGYFLYLPRQSPINSTVDADRVVMHSEDLADHDRLKQLMDARRAEAESDTEREGIDMFMDFEQKHRQSSSDRASLTTTS